MAGEIIAPTNNNSRRLVTAGNKLILPRLGGSLLSAPGLPAMVVDSVGVGYWDNAAINSHYWYWYFGNGVEFPDGQETFSVDPGVFFKQDFTFEQWFSRSGADASDYADAQWDARRGIVRMLGAHDYPGGPESLRYGKFPAAASANGSASFKEFTLTAPSISYSETYRRRTGNIGYGKASIQVSDGRVISLAFPGADAGARVHATAILRHLDEIGWRYILSLHNKKYSYQLPSIIPTIDIFAPAGDVWNNKWPAIDSSPQFVRHQTVELGAVRLAEEESSEDDTNFVLSEKDTAIDFVFTVPTMRVAVFSFYLFNNIGALIEDALGNKTTSSGYPAWHTLASKARLDITINSIGN